MGVFREARGIYDSPLRFVLRVMIGGSPKGYSGNSSPSSVLKGGIAADGVALDGLGHGLL